MKRKVFIEIGKKYNKWLVLEETELVFGHRTYSCQCECGNISKIRDYHLVSGKSKQCRRCASSKINIGHGFCKHKLYKKWASAKQRCCNPNTKKYKNYGGRGIKMCDEWLHNPKAFIDWALANGYKEGLELDRINNDGNYEPSNCRFIKGILNCRNKSNNVLTLEQIATIKALPDKEYKCGKLAQKYNCSTDTIRRARYYELKYLIQTII